MQKIAVCFVLVFSLLSAQNIMRIDSTQIAVNDTGMLSIHIENSDPFVGFQCDLCLPESLTVYDAELTERAVDHNLTLIDRGENNYRVLVYSITNTPFTGNSGKIMDLFLIAGASSGSYEVTLDSAIIGNTSAENILTSSENGYVEIIDTTSTGINRGSIIPSDYEIKINNYPNPFNPVTSICYQLFADSKTDLSIFDLNGKKISSLYSGQQDPGYYELHWLADSYPGGIYFARLQTDENISTRKMLLLK